MDIIEENAVMKEKNYLVEIPFIVGATELCIAYLYGYVIMTSEQGLKDSILKEEEPVFISETIAGWGQEQGGPNPPEPPANLEEPLNAQNPSSLSLRHPSPVRVSTAPPTDVIETFPTNAGALRVESFTNFDLLTKQATVMPPDPLRRLEAVRNVFLSLRQTTMSAWRNWSTEFLAFSAGPVRSFLMMKLTFGGAFQS